MKYPLPLGSHNTTAEEVSNVAIWRNAHLSPTLQSQLLLHGQVRIVLNLVAEGSVLWQPQRIFKPNSLVTAAQNVRHEIVRRGNAATNAAHSNFIGHATFRSQLHGKARAVQASDFFFLFCSQKGNACGC